MESRDLFIMRHAKSDWNHEHISDFDRPLNKRGQRDAPAMAKWMLSEKLQPEFLIVSPALRAKQTATEIIEQLGIPDSSINYDKRLYLASAETLLNVIRDTDNKINSLMLVGHNPGLENLALVLCKDDIPLEPGGSLMTTANVIHLRFYQKWHNLENEACEFVQVMRPKQLP